MAYTVWTISLMRKVEKRHFFGFFTYVGNDKLVIWGDDIWVPKGFWGCFSVPVVILVICMSYVGYILCWRWPKMDQNPCLAIFLQKTHTRSSYICPKTLFDIGNRKNHIFFDLEIKYQVYMIPGKHLKLNLKPRPECSKTV